MTENHFEFKLSDLGIKARDIEYVMGYKEEGSTPVISELLSTSLKELENTSRIRAEYRIINGVQFNEARHSVQANGIIFDVRKIVYNQLKRSDSIAVFLCTAGEEPGKLSREAMKEGDLLKGYIYDMIGSEIVESAADIMQEELKSAVESSGKKISNRYSPGYCDWDVSEQHKLFQLIPDNFCGIKLTDSALMNPVKSISGFIGIGENVRYNKYTCKLCDFKNCLYRNREQNENR